MSVSKNVDVIWNLDEVEIYKLLGASGAGTEDSLDAIDSYRSIKSFAANNNGAIAESQLDEWLIEKGKVVYEKTWGAIKSIVCHIHNEGLSIVGDQNLVSYIVSAVMAVVRISSALILLVVTLAVKFGLDKLCPIPE